MVVHLGCRCRKVFSDTRKILSRCLKFYHNTLLFGSMAMKTATLTLLTSEATGRALLKAQTTELATGKNTSLLGRLDKVEVEIWTYLSWPVVLEGATTKSRGQMW